ncbi:MAG: GntR family transcriptional regulator [Tissierellia bacterium]|nr:GntR family transcriptional regulator [Tissierellia bacterium]
MELVKKSLSDQIYDILKMEILKNEIPFGSKLVNRALQKRFGVSSSPIRDAINRLYQDGLISSIDKSGATVVDFDYEFFLEVNEILLYVVKMGIELSAEKSEVNEVTAYLERYIKLQEENIELDAFFDYDYKFHKTFIDFSHNSRLEKIFKEYNVLHEMLVRNSFLGKTPRLKQESIDMHIRIKDAYKEGNIQLALDLTKEHYKAAEKIFESILKHKEEVNKDD